MYMSRYVPKAYNQLVGATKEVFQQSCFCELKMFTLSVIKQEITGFVHFMEEATVKINVLSLQRRLVGLYLS